MIKIICPPRPPDCFGSGEFGASRGNRTHKGIDYAAQPNSKVLALRAGKVTKLGYTYSDDLRFRYVQVTDSKGYNLRYFYVEPMVKVGKTILVDDCLGTVQDLDERYKGITPHIHFEIKDKNSMIINPKDYFEDEDTSDISQ